MQRKKISRVVGVTRQLLRLIERKGKASKELEFSDDYGTSIDEKASDRSCCGEVRAKLTSLQAVPALHEWQSEIFYLRPAEVTFGHPVLDDTPVEGGHMHAVVAAASPQAYAVGYLYVSKDCCVWSSECGTSTAIGLRFLATWW